jgi:hypothetical protein
MAIDVDGVGSAATEALRGAAFGRGALLQPTARPRLRPRSSLSVRPLGWLGWSAVAVAFLLFNEFALEQLRTGGAIALAQENGPLEDLQLVVMLVAIAIFCFAGFKSRAAVGVAGFLMAATGTIIVLRELDFKEMLGIASLFDWLIAEHLQNGLFAVVGFATALFAFAQRRYFWDLVRLGLRWQAWPCFVAFCLLATAEFYLDGRATTSGHFWEELVETNGYLLLVLAAWVHAALVGHPALDRAR